MNDKDFEVVQDGSDSVDDLLGRGYEKSDEIAQKISSVLSEREKEVEHRSEYFNVLKDEMITDPELLAEVMKYVDVVRTALNDCIDEKAKGKVTINLTYKMYDVEEWDVKGTLPSKKG